MSAMKKVLPFFISLITIIALNACGGGNDEIHNWVIPENISGIWEASFPDSDYYPSDINLQEYQFTIEENSGIISGNFEEFYYDGKYFIYPIEGFFNSTNGYLTISHNSYLGGYHTEIFRFTSEALMYAISDNNHDLPRYECVKISGP
jgi:hypothetical protein